MRLVLATLATAFVLLVLDLTWIGKLGAPFYASLGPLKRAEVHLPAAALFYVLYVVAIVVHAVRPATSLTNAMGRGAGLGLVCYATYELTNWAVIQGWPASLVPVDILWGVALTAVSAGVGKRVLG